jgi:DNA repair exonuclease SbcCD ATPase subunit
MEVLSHTMNGSLSNKPGSTSLNGSSGNGEEEAGLKAAQNLVRTILGDNSATLTRSSCYKALEHHFERLSELELTMAKVEKIKGRRDALAGPIKRLTFKLQAAAKERHAAHKQAAKQEKEMKRLRQQLKDSQEAVEKLSQQNSILSRGEQSVIACEELVLEEEENDNSLNLLEDISESPADPLSEESEEELKEKGADATTFSLLLEEKERKIEILEEYLMVESGVKSPVNYWEMQLAFCATSILPEAIENMDEALMQLRLQGAKVDITTWNNFMKFWASSGLPDAPEKMEELVEFMRKVSLYSCSVLVLILGHVPVYAQISCVVL